MDVTLNSRFFRFSWCLGILMSLFITLRVLIFCWILVYVCVCRTLRLRGSSLHTFQAVSPCRRTACFSLKEMSDTSNSSSTEWSVRIEGGREVKNEWRTEQKSGRLRGEREFKSMKDGEGGRSKSGVSLQLQAEWVALTLQKMNARSCSSSSPCRSNTELKVWVEMCGQAVKSCVYTAC